MSSQGGTARVEKYNIGVGEAAAPLVALGVGVAGVTIGGGGVGVSGGGGVRKAVSSSITENPLKQPNNSKSADDRMNDL